MYSTTLFMSVYLSLTPTQMRYSEVTEPDGATTWPKVAWHCNFSSYSSPPGSALRVLLERPNGPGSPDDVILRRVALVRHKTQQFHSAQNFTSLCDTDSITDAEFASIQLKFRDRTASKTFKNSFKSAQKKGTKLGDTEMIIATILGAAKPGESDMTLYALAFSKPSGNVSKLSATEPLVKEMLRWYRLRDLMDHSSWQFGKIRNNGKITHRADELRALLRPCPESVTVIGTEDDTDNRKRKRSVAAGGALDNAIRQAAAIKSLETQHNAEVTGHQRLTDCNMSSHTI